MFGGDDTGPTSATQGTGTEPSLARQAARGGLPGRCWGPKRRGGGARVSPNAGPLPPGRATCTPGAPQGPTPGPAPASAAPPAPRAGPTHGPRLSGRHGPPGAGQHRPRAAGPAPPRSACSAAAAAQAALPGEGNRLGRGGAQARGGMVRRRWRGRAGVVLPALGPPRRPLSSCHVTGDGYKASPTAPRAPLFVLSHGAALLGAAGVAGSPATAAAAATAAAPGFHHGDGERPRPGGAGGRPHPADRQPPQLGLPAQKVPGHPRRGGERSSAARGASPRGAAAGARL